MNRELILEQLNQKYIEPTKRKRDSYIGVEIEMPIVNLNGDAVDFEVVHSLTAEFMKHFSLTAKGRDDNGNINLAENSANGDTLSYDCSYNNLEFSFGKEKNLHEIYRRFSEYYSFIEEYLKRFNYTLTGMGVNPNWRRNHNVPIENGRYRMLFHHLHSYQNYDLPMYFHKHPEFGTFSSASQVQLDVDYEKLTETINAFSKLEPIKALLFNNSILLGEDENLHCCRDMFWENSTHGINPHNIGMYECEINSPEEFLSYIATTSIYCVERGEKYINFPPINIVEYFEQEEIKGEYFDNGRYEKITFSPEASDLKYLRTFKFEDVTFRGTVEFRSVCCQPISDCMTVAAFHLGLMKQTSRLKEILDNDTVIYHRGYNPSELRKIFLKADLPEFIDVDQLYLLANQILDLSAEGLKERGLGEETFLAPLYERAEKRTNPAKTLLSLKQNGVELNEIIKLYGKL